MRRLLSALLIALVGLVPAALPAHAATGTNAAATWLVTQVSGGALNDGFSKVGASVDGLIGLAAATDPGLQPTIDALLATVKTGASSYVASGGGSAAAKLAIVAAAYGIDPTSFGGVDLVAALKAGVASDGSVGPWPSAFGSGLTMAGFKRTGTTQPSALTTWLLTQQNADGGFGYAAGAPSDADDTALAILGLVTDSSATAKAALAKAVAWASAAQKADGSWDGYVPVNSTCVMGSALLAAGVSQAKARSYVTSQQLASGAIGASGEPNLMATSQCLPFLGGGSYLSVVWKPKTLTVSPTPTTAPTTGRGVPAHTGDEDQLPLLPLTVVGASVLGLAVLLRKRA